MIPLTYTPVEDVIAYQNKVLARQGQERGPVSSHLSRPAQPDEDSTKEVLGMKTITVNERLAQALLDWAHDEQAYWPNDTAFRADLDRLVGQLNPVAGVDNKRNQTNDQ